MSGTSFKELQQVLTSNNRGQIQVLLRELQSEGNIYCTGKTDGANWFVKEELLQTSRCCYRQAPVDFLQILAGEPDIAAHFPAPGRIGRG